MSYNPQFFMQQCLQALGNNATALSKEATTAQWDLLKKTFPFGKTGKVEWENINKKIVVKNTAEDILGALEVLLQKPVDKNIYIQWSDDTLPIVKTDLTSALSLLEDLKKVTFELFLFNPAQGYVIEILPKNNITIGLRKKEQVPD